VLHHVKLVSLVVIGPVVCCLVGCGDGGAADAIQKRRSNLQQLGIAYQRYHEGNQRSPADAIELLGFMKSQVENDPQLRDAIISLEEGDIVMAWDGQINSATKNADFVLGFEAGVPSTGGYVVMGDGAVQLMTAKDYSKASLLPSRGK
jgi:hypothetical protein